MAYANTGCPMNAPAPEDICPMQADDAIDDSDNTAGPGNCCDEHVYCSVIDCVSLVMLVDTHSIALSKEEYKQAAIYVPSIESHIVAPINPPPILA